MNSNSIKEFEEAKVINIDSITNDSALQKLGIDFIEKTGEKMYSYNFTWMGRPIIAYPQDMIAMQELIWKVKPDLIIETGVAHGGSIVYYASLLELIGGDGLVVGIDIDIRKHNKDLIEAHSMYKRLKLIEGSSISDKVFEEVVEIARSRKKIMVCLDSNHTHEHVIQELNKYAPLTSVGSYCVVFDTVVEDMPLNYNWGQRPWGKGNNPKTAVYEYLKLNSDFVIDKNVHGKLVISVAPDGFLKRIK